MSLTSGFVEITNCNAYFASDTVTDDMLIRTGSNFQRIVFATLSTSNSTMIMSNNIVSFASNVGIGKTNPAYALDVNGTINATNLFVGGLPYSGGGGGGGGQWSSNAANMYTIGSNVGIGTSTPSESLQSTAKIYGQVQVLGPSNDSVSIPAFSWKENSNTGMFHASNNMIGFTTGGSERVRVTDLGYVGIGTSNPGSFLSVAGGATVGTALSNSTAPTNGIMVQGAASLCNNLNVYGSATVSNITTLQSNLVVAGTATFSNDVTVIGKLSVSNVTYITSNIQIYASEVVQSNLSVYQAATLCNNLTVYGTTIHSNVTVMASNLTFSNYGSVVCYTSNNYLGIGISNPAYTLDVNGNANVASNLQVKTLTCTSNIQSSWNTIITNTGNASALTLTPDATVYLSAVAPYMQSSTDNGALPGTSSNARPMHIYASNITYDARFGSHYFNNGSVGIGKSAPSYKLDVAGDINFTGTLRSNGIAFSGGGSSQWSNNLANVFITGSNVGIGTTSPAYPLDVNSNARIVGGVANKYDLICNNVLMKSYNKTLGVTVTDYTNICTLTSTSMGFVVDLAIAHSESGSSESRRYSFAFNFALASTSFTRLQPISSSGPYSTNDWAVDINTSGYATTLRLVRVSGSASSANFTCSLIVYQSQVDTVAIADSATTGTGATNVGIFAATPLTQVGGYVGVSKSNPGYPLDVAGDINFTGTLRSNGIAFGGINPWTSNSTNIYITGSNVGIGTTSPSSNLHVVGASMFNGMTSITTADTWQSSFNITNTSSSMQWQFLVGGSLNGNTAAGIGGLAIWSGGTTSGGSFKLNINSNGNIGIAKTNPAYLLDVAGDINFTGTLRSNGIAFGGINPWTSNSTNIYITGSNVGIGTTTPAALLHVNCDMLVDTWSNSATFSNDHGISFRNGISTALGNMYNCSITTYDYRTVANQGGVIRPDGLSINGYYGVGICTGSTTRQERVRVDNAGNVGVGISNPVYKLDVAGDINFTGTLRSNGVAFTGSGGTSQWSNNLANVFVTGSNVGIGLSNPSYPLDIVGMMRVSSNVNINRCRLCFSGTPTDANHTIYNNYGNLDGEGSWDGMKVNCYAGFSVRTGNAAGATPTTSFYVNSTGAGIGTTAPSESVHSTSKIYSQVQLLGNSNDSITVPSFSWKENSNTGMFHPSNNVIGFTTGGVERARINSSGYVGIGTSNPLYPLQVTTQYNNVSISATYDIVAFSDLRVKKDLIRISNALEKISAINGYTFARADSSVKYSSSNSNIPFESRYAGVVAQEVAKVLPEVVHEDADGMMSVAYGNMAALFIEAIKDLKQEIREIKERIGMV